MFQGRPLLGTALSALLSGLSLLAFMVTGSWGLFFNVLFLALAGGFNCGPDTILGKYTSEMVYGDVIQTQLLPI